MQTKNYTTDLLPLVKALCGVEFATIEEPRIKAMINSRAKRAYRASPYWPRFLVVGESRVATAGVIPFTEGSLDDIDTFIHINRTQPYQTATAQLIEYDVTSSGATLTDGNLNLTAAFVTYKKQLQDVYGDGSSGTTVNVPDEWFEYLAHGTYSDFLRSEGQQEKAALADQEAHEKLAEEMTTDNFTHTINKLTNQRFHTHLNSTTRW
jgi:hypothetical protein